MSLFEGWFGGRRRVKLSLADPANWNFGDDSAAGKIVTPGTVMNLATAWSCVRLLSETIGTLPLGVYRKDGARRIADPNHGLYSLLHDTPNADQTAAEFWEAQVASLCLRGNGFAEITRSAGQVRSLDFLRPDQMTVRRDASGARVYDYKDRGKTETLPEEKVFHLRGFGVGGDVGLSPISYGRQTFGTAIAADETAAKTFANGLQVSGFVELPAGVKPDADQRNQLIELFNKFTGSSRAGKVMPLEGGMKFTPLTMNPEDAQLLETRAFHVEEICRWFRVPPFMVGHTEKSTSWGTGLEQQMIGFLTFSLRPYLTRIEQAVKKQLIAPGERTRVYAEFNLEGLLRADSSGRASLYSQLAQNGVSTRNEIRARENLPPMDGGDQLTVQSNLVPLDQLGRSAARPTMPAAGEPL